MTALKKQEKQLEVFKRVFKGIHNKGTLQQKGEMKTKPKLLLRSETVFRKNIQRVYNLCVKCPIPDLKEFLTYPPNVIVPKHFIDVESASSELFTRDAQCAADLLQQPYGSNGAASLCNKQSPRQRLRKKFLLSLGLKNVLMVV
ncbi:Hypothetical predicted protein, partial [Paramuricea clavata]